MTYLATSPYDIEIAKAKLHLRSLYAARLAAWEKDRDTICREFDAGASVADIAKRYGRKKSAIKGILNRSGRTSRRRDLLRQKIAEHAERHGAEQVQA